MSILMEHVSGGIAKMIANPGNSNNVMDDGLKRTSKYITYLTHHYFEEMKMAYYVCKPTSKMQQNNNDHYIVRSLKTVVNEGINVLNKGEEKIREYFLKDVIKAVVIASAIAILTGAIFGIIAGLLTLISTAILLHSYSLFSQLN